MGIITKTSCQTWLQLLTPNEVRLGGPGGGADKPDFFEAIHHLILVAMAVVFEADVPGGNCVTVGFDSPLVRPSTCIRGEGQNIRKGMENVERTGVRLSKGVCRVKVADGC